MKITWSRVLLILLATGVIAAPPVIGHWVRRSAPARCALDGLDIDPMYRVRLIDQQGNSRDFCCIRCAERWLSLAPEPTYTILVTDEASGEFVDSREATFVESRVESNSYTANSIHCFRHYPDADIHAATFGGHELQGSERPFARWERASVQ